MIFKEHFMKKVLLSIAFVLPLVAYASDYGVNVPEWEDFAPPVFVDVKEPKGMGKLNVVASYWYKRRIDFEDALAKCQELEENDARFACYEELKVEQFKENTDYNARVEARQNNANGGIPEMNNRTDTMLPINNYINNYTRFMPNELR